MRYIETRCENGKRVLIKLDTIRCIEERVVYANTDALCTVDSRNVKIPYEEIKKLVQDERRSSILDDSVDFRMRFIMTQGIWDIIKDFPGEDAVVFLKDILNAKDENEMWKIAINTHEKRKEK